MIIAIIHTANYAGSYRRPQNETSITQRKVLRLRDFAMTITPACKVQSIGMTIVSETDFTKNLEE
ncbi:hypothetical protein C1X64_12925 [Pseudomonas sp. GW456-E7]|nr:hypothetical protein C1X64_12925 [Pseudomonas sp. GW456-E7]